MTSEKQNKTLPLKAVYCYYFPEVRSIIDRVVAAYPHETFLQSINPGLDDYHFPVIASYLRHFENQLSDLSQFPFQYVTAGASEGIFHFLARLAAVADKPPLYVLNGEYEGYQGYGANLGLNFTVVPEAEDFPKLDPGVIFVSNPSARDGNIIDNSLINAACQAGHKVVYDLTYVGLTDPYRFDLSHENIIAAFVSLSKPFGLYYHRVGFTFSRFALPTLAVNKWFKNILSLDIAKAVLETIGETELVDRYRSFQDDAIAQLQKDHALTVQPSQVVILGSAANGTVPAGWENYSRRHNYRFCLTPYYLKKERGFV